MSRNTFGRTVIRLRCIPANVYLLSAVPYVFGLLCLAVGLLISDVAGGVLGGIVGYFLGKSVQSFVWATASE